MSGPGRSGGWSWGSERLKGVSLVGDVGDDLVGGFGDGLVVSVEWSLG